MFPLINRCSEELWVIFAIDVHATNIVNIGLQKMAYVLGNEISDLLVSTPTKAEGLAIPPPQRVFQRLLINALSIGLFCKILFQFLY